LLDGGEPLAALLYDLKEYAPKLLSADKQKADAIPINLC
jgi:hypothetical protein